MRRERAGARRAERTRRTNGRGERGRGLALARSDAISGPGEPAGRSRRRSSARRVEHFDADAVAEAHERRRRLAADQRLDGPLLGDARIARRPRPPPAGPGRRPPCSTRCPSRRCCPPRARASSRRARSASRSRTSCRRPAFGRPNSAPLRCETSGRCTLPSRHASPSSSGVTATGENALAGFDWRKPKPFASSRGNEVAQAHVVDEHQQHECAGPRPPRSCPSARRR